MKKTYTFISYIGLIILSGLAVLNYRIFVYPNTFVPAGVDGICTIIQHLTEIGVGYSFFIINIPLIVFGFFATNKDFMFKTIVYTVSFSSISVLFDYVDLSAFIYHTENGTSTVLAPLAAGVVRGLLYSGTLFLGGSSGGIDIISAAVKRKHPQYHFMSIVFAINVTISLVAYVTYGFKPEAVICSILYFYITSRVCKSVKITKSTASHNINT